MSRLQRALRKIQGKPGETSGSRVGEPEAVKVPEPHRRALPPVRRPEDVMPAVVFPFDKMRAEGLLGPQSQTRMIADQFRRIKRPLIANIAGKRVAKVADGNFIMVTSAVSGEGKTVTSVNLALSMSREQDYRVVLVDADVAKPLLSRMLGLESKVGLLDAARDDQVPTSKIIYPTDVPGLSVVPVGEQIQTATELLASDQMERVLRRIQSEYKSNIVVLDSPPMLLTTEAAALSSKVGQIVFVVMAEQTPQQTVLDALAVLDDSRAISIVLNQCSEADAYVSYGYGYGQGADDEAVQKSMD